jgi:transglutaminase-like putative cysteine protease
MARRCLPRRIGAPVIQRLSERARRRSPRLAAVAAVVGAIAVAAVAVAQNAPRRRTLHEDLPAPEADDDSPLIGATPGEGQNPAAFSSGDKVLPEPDTGGQARHGEPILGLRADRDTETRPDYNTGPDGTLRYASVFNPDVLPFKRMSALDAVRTDYTLHVVNATTVDLPVGGRTDPSRDRFWGSVMIDLEPGRNVALPSVAPDMRILSYEVTPTIALTFSKDGADNFFVRSADPAARGQHRLVFLVDADAGYFAPKIPSRSYTLSQVRRLAEQRNLLPALPPSVRLEAEASLATLGVELGDDLERAFDRLVYYFRDFEAKQLGDVSGNIYRDLFDTQAGVCRHRSFAFIVTALAAGIPTRYVTNEAHAFVEVWFPERGWQRIDLGGAALRMEVTGAEDKTLHRPRHDDPFAKPQRYDQGYTQLEGDIRGLTADQLAERREPLGSGSSGDFDPLVDDGGDTAAAGDASAVSPDRHLDNRPPLDPRKQTPTVVITLADDVGYRGETLRIHGRVQTGATPVGGSRVDVWVSPLGRDGEDARLIGRGATQPDGTFAVEADLPADLDLRTYEIFASTPETDRLNPGISE